MNNQNSSNEDPFGKALAETLLNSDLFDIVQDVSELGLDSILAEGVFKDLPIVGSIVGVGKTAAAIRDLFLLRKVSKFLEHLGSIPEEKRRGMAEKVHSESDYSRRVAETIILYLDRYDHVDKAELLSRVFVAYCKELLDRDEFLRLASAIDRAFLRDLEILLEYFSIEDPEQVNVRTTKRNLNSSDFSDFYVLTHQEFERSRMEHPQVYHFNELAKTFARIVLGDRFREDRW